MAERKRRATTLAGLSAGKKDLAAQAKVIKDVYDFDEEESASEPGFTSVLSYRARLDAPKEMSMSALLSKTIGDTLNNGKSVSAIGESLESMVDRKFRDMEKLPPSRATRSPLVEGHEKHHHHGNEVKNEPDENEDEEEEEEEQEDEEEDEEEDDEEEQEAAAAAAAAAAVKQSVRGPMDEYVERRQKGKRSSGEQAPVKHTARSRRRSGKVAKKKSRNAWYEDDSSDEFVTRLRADDIGVGISKSQRTCSKGKQNLFAEMSSTSSESEEEMAEDLKKDAVVVVGVDESQANLAVDQSHGNGESRRPEESLVELETGKKSDTEELSDHPLVIDENLKDPPDVEQRTNSDEETEEQRTFELDDLYREDSSIVDSDRDEPLIVGAEDKSSSQARPAESCDRYISLEDALNLLDRPQEETAIKAAAAAGPLDGATREKRQGQKEEVSLDELPEKLSSNEKPQHESENLPLHVFLSRKVQESKKRKQQQQQLKKLRDEQERILLLDIQPTRRQRKCAIGKQGLLAEISSSDEELTLPRAKRPEDRAADSRGKQRQRESKERRKERYIEKKHEQMIAKEQKAIEEAIMRELEEKRLSGASEASEASERDEKRRKPSINRKHTTKRMASDNENDEEGARAATLPRGVVSRAGRKKRVPTKSAQRPKKPVRPEAKRPKHTTNATQQRRWAKNRPSEQQQRDLEDLDGDEELKATKSWNKLDEGVGVAIGRRKRAAANQLYYWSSSSDDEQQQHELTTTTGSTAAVAAATVATTVTTVTAATAATAATAVTAAVETGGQDPMGQADSTAGSQDGQEEEDDRPEQHGWIVGDSHKKMITMLAMEKQMKEKRRRSENDEQSPTSGASLATGKAKSKKHRNSTS